MKQYLLLLPIIFIFHDMEEVCGFIWFFKQNPYLFDRFPKVMTFNILTVLSVVAAIILLMINLKLCHKLARYVSDRIKADEAQSKPLPE